AEPPAHGAAVRAQPSRPSDERFLEVGAPDGPAFLRPVDEEVAAVVAPGLAVEEGKQLVAESGPDGIAKERAFSRAEEEVRVPRALQPGTVGEHAAGIAKLAQVDPPRHGHTHAEGRS